MIKRIKAYLSLPKGKKHYTRWFVFNYDLLYRLKQMTPHEVVILSDYTDEQIRLHGVKLLYVMTKKLSLKPNLLGFADTRTLKTLADSVVIYQKHEYGNKLIEYKQIKSILENEVL